MTDDWICDWNTMGLHQLPGWIIALLSHDTTKQNEADIQLAQYLYEYSESWHEYQEVLKTDGPVLITPFLVEMLAIPHVNKNTIFRMLNVLCYYHKEPELEGIYRDRAYRIYGFLLKHFDLFLSFLDTDDVNVKTLVIYLLSRFKEKSETFMQLIFDYIENQKLQADLVKIVCAETLFEKVKTNDQPSVRFVKAMHSWVLSPGESLEVRSIAAYYLINLLKDKAGKIAMETLLQTLTPPFHANLGTEHWERFQLISKLRDRFVINGLMRILEIQTDNWMIFMSAACLLVIVFNDGEFYEFDVVVNHHTVPTNIKIYVKRSSDNKPSFRKDNYRDVLKSILEKDQIWECQNNLLEVFSLPTSKEELKRFLQ
jgi:hypothetical protein